LNSVVDMDRFLSMIAMETILCHSDSYSMNRNNYRLYLDPATARFVFIPHGMDRILGAHRSGLDLAVVPPVLGLVARAALSTPEGRRQYVGRAGTLFTNLFEPERLSARVREIDARIYSARTNHGEAGRFDRMAARPEDDANELCARINRRAAELRLQFADTAALLAPAPFPSFDERGEGLLPAWKLRRAAVGPGPGCVIEFNGPVVRLRSTNGPLAAVLQCRFTISSGHDQLRGRLTAANAAGASFPVALTVLRFSTGDRFDTVKRNLGAGPFNHGMHVREVRDPEEIDLGCEVREPSGEAWIDFSTLRLVAAERAETATRPGRPTR
jgi:hypothetical protein